MTPQEILRGLAGQWDHAEERSWRAAADEVDAMAARIAALEAGMQRISNRYVGKGEDPQDVINEMRDTARAALAPAPEPAVMEPVAWLMTDDAGNGSPQLLFKKPAATNDMWTGWTATPLRAALAPAPAPGEWEKCHKGSCHRHKACMYMPCLLAPAPAPEGE